MTEWISCLSPAPDSFATRELCSYCSLSPGVRSSTALSISCLHPNPVCRCGVRIIKKWYKCSVKATFAAVTGSWGLFMLLKGNSVQYRFRSCLLFCLYFFLPFFFQLSQSPSPFPGMFLLFKLYTLPSWEDSPRQITTLPSMCAYLSALLWLYAGSDIACPPTGSV